MLMARDENILGGDLVYGADLSELRTKLLFDTLIPGRTPKWREAATVRGIAVHLLDILVNERRLLDQVQGKLVEAHKRIKELEE